MATGFRSFANDISPKKAGVNSSVPTFDNFKKDFKLQPPKSKNIFKNSDPSFDPMKESVMWE